MGRIWHGYKLGNDLRNRHVGKEVKSLSWRYSKKILSKQAKRYSDVSSLFLKYSDNIERFTFWVVWDGNSWRDYRPMLGRTDYPLLIDRRLKRNRPMIPLLIGQIKIATCWLMHDGILFSKVSRLWCQWLFINCLKNPVVAKLHKQQLQHCLRGLSCDCRRPLVSVIFVAAVSCLKSRLVIRAFQVRTGSYHRLETYFDGGFYRLLW